MTGPSEPMDSDGAPSVVIDRVAEAQGRFDAAIAGLGDDDVRRPSLLPGWSVGHVLAHLSRNADSHKRRAEAAARGVVVEQYPGGYAGRAAEIDRDSRRTAAVLIADVHKSGTALIEFWRSLPDEAWSNTVVDVSGREYQLWYLTLRRWQELEIHVVDIGIGITPESWPDEFVRERLPVMRLTLSNRLSGDDRAPEPGTISERDELAWLFGRPVNPGLPDLAPWE
jgi:maleylpyruvate isomerase